MKTSHKSGDVVAIGGAVRAARKGARPLTWQELEDMTRLSRPELEGCIAAHVAHEREGRTKPQLVDDLEVSVRAWHALRRAGFIRVDELRYRGTAQRILAVKDSGARTLNEIRRAVLALGLAFDGSFDGPAA